MAAVSRSVPPGWAWLALFLPALAYLISTRAPRASSIGRVIGNHIQLLADEDGCEALAQIIYLASPCSSSSASLSLSYPLTAVIETGLEHVTASVWRHDAYLGRGYILLSDSAGAGRIWRWEIGGGPISIGKTLHMEASGCRSSQYRDCTMEKTGSGGLTIDYLGKDQYSEGRLVVAEWGEGRIARIEEETGARTPLVMHVANVCGGPDKVRVAQPTNMLYTAFGDLLFVDEPTDCNRTVLYQVRSALHVEQLESLRASRAAHEWTSLPQPLATSVMYQAEGRGSMGGLALTAQWTDLYLSVRLEDSSVVLMQLPLVVVDEERQAEPKMVFNLSQHVPTTDPGVMVVDRQSNMYWATEDGILIVAGNQVLARLPVPAPVTSLTLGDDSYLYATTSTALLRIRVRHGPVKVPTNMVVKP